VDEIFTAGCMGDAISDWFYK